MDFILFSSLQFSPIFVFFCLVDESRPLGNVDGFLMLGFALLSLPLFPYLFFLHFSLLTNQQKTTKVKVSKNFLLSLSLVGDNQTTPAMFFPLEK